MKIIRLSTFLDFGGIESKMVNLSTTTNAQMEWVFCAIGKGGVASEKIKENGKRVVLFESAYRIPSLLTIYRLYRFFKSEQPDVVHTSGAEANFHGVLAARWAGVKNVVAEEIGIPKHGFLAQKIFGVIFKLSHYVLGESKMVCDNLYKLYAVPKKKLKIVSNFVVFSPEKESARKGIKQKDVFTIVSVSRLEAVKNIESVLRTVAKLTSEKFAVQYTIVGEGNHRKVLETLVAALKIENNVTFVGFQSDPVPFLRESDVYVLTSFTEGFSNSLAEALYNGTPSLSTKVGAATEIITDNQNGWLVEAADDEALFRKIKSIIALDPETRKQIGQTGRTTIIDNYSIENHLETLTAIYLKKE